ncbi:chromatin structure-remodeling complex protein SYD-like isoform X2 [Macadamia integrifolia]|uniref:chromatin structure-remodeling complex protein SYD-like isoform X2 n=1 Tax=Macadamia integrifolia TaxID=60698 RepID=UPI001C4E4A4C|nr:chromatin structure-remodeling complex protein SYD-like isoform X2 [Macadamia integrifolia]
MAASHHVEIEAAKFLQKLIHESKDEPAKLATKLYVICQHMKMSGKEQSLPYQVISRAMETVINQNGIDIEALKSSRLPMTGGTQMGDSGVSRSADKEKLDIQPSVGLSLRGPSVNAWHAGSSSKINDDVYGGSSQGIGVLKESKAVFPENEMGRLETVVLNRPPAGPSRSESVGHDAYHGSVSQRSGKLFDHESPSSLDTRSANSQERRDKTKPDNQGRKKDTKKASAKRKRADSTSALETHNDNPHQLDSPSIRFNPRKGKPMNKGDAQGGFALKGGEHNPVQSSGHVDYLSSLSGGLGSIFKTKQENQSLIERPGDKTKTTNSMSWAPTPKYPEEGEVSSAHGALGQQKGGMQLSRHEILSSGGWIQNKVAFQSENSQGSRFPLNIVSSGSTAEQLAAQSPGTSKEAGQSSEGAIHCKAGSFWQQQSAPQSAQQKGEESLGGIGNVHGGISGAFGSYPMVRPGFSAPMQYNSSPFNSHDLTSKIHKERIMESSSGSQLLEKNNDMMVNDTPVKSPAVEFSSTKVAFHSELRKPGFIRDAVPSISEKGMDAQFCSSGRQEEALSGGRVLEQDRGILNSAANSSKMVQGCESNSNMEISMAQGGPSRDTGKTPMSQLPVSGMPFKEQHLKQLRAQCLVFLAFRNGMVPRKLHLEIALGESNQKEGSSADGACRELTDHRGKESYLREPTNSNGVGIGSGRTNDIRDAERVPPGSSSTGSLIDTDSSKETKNIKKTKKQKGSPADQLVLAEEGQRLLSATRKPEAEMQTQETAESQDDPDHGHQQVGRANQIWRGISNHNEAPRGMMEASMVQHEQVLERAENPLNQSQTYGDSDRVNKLFKVEAAFMQASQQTDKYPSSVPLGEQTRLSGKGVEPHMLMSLKDVNPLTMHALQGGKHSSKPEPIVFNSFADVFVGANCGPEDQRGSEIQKQSASDGCKMISINRDPITVLEKSPEEEEEEKSSTETPPSPKYTTSEKWIMDWQKRKLLGEENWALKQKKMEEKITGSFDKLKETVSSSEDISAKTRSVIELKKLQLLRLQRRLRSDFLHDFFKPVTSDMDRLKAVKKHRHGRRVKQVEKFEQKMKEERQKRIRERQKEFFTEIEVHKERMDDWFKIKRERWKGFNKHVKEFHKRKERIHREKIDRIQREKINLLKNNDVEGYLRMVQDAKSDRVKQLLKETEKYLQKLGAKVQESKTTARRFEMEKDEGRSANVVENNEVAIENEDESDQAQHYLESNEKYYLMAHSIKENITEQPTCLQGGKLREYQMNGLQWLVSLYNNHLNGILADEMGLGKTVQVIALICYLMETKNDRGPFLVVVPSSVLSGWESEISNWAPGINKIAYAGPPEERRRLFKERIVHGKFNVLLTTYEYLMNKHDRPRLSKIHWHYIVIDEGHRIKNASCKLNADLKLYQSSHRLLLTGTPLQNNLEELWALLNFLLPNIFNSSEDFSQWFNKPFESSGDNSPDEALLSEEENLLIINRLHQVLRPFVLRRLKHKVENELPEKIERLVRCEASAYQKLLMKRVEENLGSIGSSKGRSVHNSVMELRNICNHPYISQLHAEEVDTLIPKHYLPPLVRLCGKLEMLDRLLPKLKATDHRVLFFSTMTRLLDVMEDYLHWKRYRYLRLDGHTSGNDRGALIEEFNRPDSPAFIFLLSIRAGGVGVNLQAADTVIIFDTDWNPQVDLQAQARAHRIGQKRDVLVLRLETVWTVEEHVRAAAEHKLGVANQSITAGFFDNNTSAEDRREYLESLLRESKKEEAAPVLDDDALNDLLARSESEIDVFESIDRRRREEEMAAWHKLVLEQDKESSDPLPPMPSRLVTDDDLKALYQAMQVHELSNVGAKRKGEYLGGLDTQHYGRGKRAREVRSYEDQWTEEEFEKMCQADSPESPKQKEEAFPKQKEETIPKRKEDTIPKQKEESIPQQKEETISKGMAMDASASKLGIGNTDPPPLAPPLSTETSQLPGKELPQPSRRGRGRPKRAEAASTDTSPSAGVVPAPSDAAEKLDMGSQRKISSSPTAPPSTGNFPDSVAVKDLGGTTLQEFSIGTAPGSLITTPVPSVHMQVKGQSRKVQSGSEAPRRRAKKQSLESPAVQPERNLTQIMPMERGMSSDSSLASVAHDNQRAVRPSSATNAPYAVSSESNSISRGPKEMSMMSESSSAFVTQKLVSGPPNTSNAPTIVSFEVNPITGLPKVVELVPVRTTMPSFAQEKYMRVGPSFEKKETEKFPIPETKLAETSSSARTDCTSSVESNKKEGVKVSVLPSEQEPKVTQSSTPVISALAQDLKERRSLRMGTLDKKRSSEKTETISVQTGTIPNASKIVPISGTVPGRAVHVDLPVVKAVESVAGQDSTRYGNAPGMSSLNMRNEKPSVPVPLHQMKSSADKATSKSPAPVKRGTKRKVLRVSNAKQAAVAIKSSHVVGTAVPTVHAPMVDSQIAEGNRSSVKSITIKDKLENDSQKVGIVIDDKARQNLVPDVTSNQRPNSTERSDLSIQGKQPPGTSTLHESTAISMDKSSVCAEVNGERNLISDQSCEVPPPILISSQELISDLKPAQDKQHLTCHPISEYTISSMYNTTPCLKPTEVKTEEDCCSHIPNISYKKLKLTEESNLPAESMQGPGTSTLQENVIISMEKNSDCLGANAQRNDSTEKPCKIAPPDMVSGQEPNSNEKSFHDKGPTCPSMSENASCSVERESTISVEAKASPNDESSLSEMPDIPSNNLTVSLSGQLSQSVQPIPNPSGTHGIAGYSVGSINIENTDDAKQLGRTTVCQGEVQTHDIAPSISLSGQVSEPDEQVFVPSKRDDSSSLLGESDVPNLANTIATEFASSQLSQTDDKVPNTGITGKADIDQVNPNADDANKPEGATVPCQGETEHNTAPSMSRSGQVPPLDDKVYDLPSFQDANADPDGYAYSEDPGAENHSDVNFTGDDSDFQVEPEHADDAKKPDDTKKTERIAVLCQGERKHDTGPSITGSDLAPLLDEQVSDPSSTHDANVDPHVSANSEDPGAENNSEMNDTTHGQIEVFDLPNTTPIEITSNELCKVEQVVGLSDVHVTGDDSDDQVKQEHADDAKKPEGIAVLCQGERKHETAPSITGSELAPLLDEQVSDPSSTQDANADPHVSANSEDPGAENNSEMNDMTHGQIEVFDLPNTAPIEITSNELCKTEEQIISLSDVHVTADDSDYQVKPEHADDGKKPEGTTTLCQGERKHDTDPSIIGSGQVHLEGEHVSDPSSTQDANADPHVSANSEHPGVENNSETNDTTHGQIEVKREHADDAKKPEGIAVLCQGERKHDTAPSVSGSDLAPLLDEQVSDPSSTQDANADPHISANSEDPGVENHSETYDTTNGQIEVKPEPADDAKKPEGTAVLCQDETKHDSFPSMSGSGKVPRLDEHVSDPMSTYDASADPDGSAKSEDPGVESPSQMYDTTHGKIEVKPECADDEKKPEGATVHSLGEVQEKDTASSMSARGHTLQIDDQDTDPSTTHHADASSDGAVHLENWTACYSNHDNSSVHGQIEAPELPNTENLEAPGKDETNECNSTAMPSQSEETEVLDIGKTVSSTQISHSDQENPSSYVCGPGDAQGSITCGKAVSAAPGDSVGMSKIFVLDQTVMVASDGDSFDHKLDMSTENAGEVNGIVQGPGDLGKTENDGDIPVEALPEPSHAPVALHEVLSDEDKMIRGTSEGENPSVPVDGKDKLISDASDLDSSDHKLDMSTQNEGEVNVIVQGPGDLDETENDGDIPGEALPEPSHAPVAFHEVLSEEDKMIRGTSEGENPSVPVDGKDKLISGASDGDSSDHKLDMSTQKAGEVNSVVEGPGDLDETENDGDIPGEALPELSHAPVALHGALSDEDKMIRGTSEGENPSVPVEGKDKLISDTSEANDKIDEAVSQGPVYSENADEGGDHPGIVPTELASGQDHRGDQLDLGHVASSVEGETDGFPSDEKEVVEDCLECSNIIDEAVSQCPVYSEKADEGGDHTIVSTQLTSDQDFHGDKLDRETTSAEGDSKEVPSDEKKLVRHTSEDNVIIDEAVSQGPGNSEEADEGDYPSIMPTELTSGQDSHGDKWDLMSTSVQGENNGVPSDKTELRRDTSEANDTINEAVNQGPVSSEKVEGEDQPSILPTELASDQDIQHDELNLKLTPIDDENKGCPVLESMQPIAAASCSLDALPDDHCEIQTPAAADQICTDERDKNFEKEVHRSESDTSQLVSTDPGEDHVAAGCLDSSKAEEGDAFDVSVVIRVDENNKDQSSEHEDLSSSPLPRQVDEKKDSMSENIPGGVSAVLPGPDDQVE